MSFNLADRRRFQVLCLPPCFEVWWCKWLDHSRLRNGRFPNELVPTQQLEKLVRSVSDTALLVAVFDRKGRQIDLSQRQQLRP